MSVFLTPGPSEPYPKLSKFMDDAWNDNVMSISHRGSAFTGIYRRTDSALRELMDIPAGYTIMFLGSATEAMERIVQGVTENRSHHFVNGAFSAKWQQIAGQLGKSTTSTLVEAGQGFTDYTVPADVDLVCLTQNETSTGVVMLAEETARVARTDSRLIALDVVSSAPLVPIDWNGLDITFFSVQKAFGLPAGLGVICASPRAIAKARELKDQGKNVGSYHSLSELAASAEKYQTPATPNVLGIYLLGRVTEDLLARGIQAVREENRVRAKRLYSVLEASDFLQPFVEDAHWRSPTVIVANVTGGSVELHRHLSGQGLEIGKGYGSFKGKHLRIANFPALSQASFDLVVSHLVQFSGARV